MVALRQENAALREEISLAEAQARSAAKPGVGPDPDAAGWLAREVASLKEALARAEAKLADPGGEIEKLQRQPKAARTQAQNERLIWLEPHVLNATIKNQFSILSSQAAAPKTGLQCSTFRTLMGMSPGIAFRRGAPFSVRCAS